jgi:hypothetical protein
MLVAVMMTAVATAFVNAPAFAAEKATQMWRCELDDDTTEEQVEAAAQKWLAAARTMKGGKNLEAYVFFPVAVNNMGQSDIIFAISAPTFAEWGEFWDGYKNSPAAKLDIANKESIVPTDSGLWEAIKVKTPASTTAKPSFSKVIQKWRCELDDDTTEEQVEAAAEKWLAAARTMKGGENLEAYVLFPVAVSDMGQSDIIFLISAPTFAEWGEFWDGYKDSPAAKLDAANKDAIVPTDSGLWEAIKVKATN